MWLEQKTNRSLATEPTRIEGQVPEGKLLSFYAHIGELSKVLIEGCHRCVFGRSGRGKRAVHEMDLRLSIAFQCVEVNRRPPDLNARAGDELFKCCQFSVLRFAGGSWGSFDQVARGNATIVTFYDARSFLWTGDYAQVSDWQCRQSIFDMPRKSLRTSYKPRSQAGHACFLKCYCPPIESRTRPYCAPQESVIWWRISHNSGKKRARRPSFKSSTERPLRDSDPSPMLR